MKKLLGIIALSLITFANVPQAQAALLNDWNYTLTNVEVSGFNTNLANPYYSENHDGQGITYTAGDVYNSVEKKFDRDFSGSYGFQGNAIGSTGTDSLLRHDTSDNRSYTYFTNGEKIATLAFTYTITSAGGEVSNSVTFSLPLYTYYDVVSDTGYIYYDNNEVSTMGRTSFMHDGYLYVVLGFNFFVDGQQLQPVDTADGNSYTGWAINDATRGYHSVDHVLDGQQYLAGDSKYYQGSYDVATSLVLFNASLYSTSSADFGDMTPSFKAVDFETPTATPEPATMLLMGAGLAGLGLRARAKKK